MFHPCARSARSARASGGTGGHRADWSAVPGPRRRPGRAPRPAGNAPYTHRRYVVGAAPGPTGASTGDRALLVRTHPVLEDGLSRQRSDAVNPQPGGYDSSYQMTGIVFAEHWAINLPDDPLTPRIRTMIQRGLRWEATRVLPSGEVSAEGNTRTAGQERARDGITKSVAYSRVIRGGGWNSDPGDCRSAALVSRQGSIDWCCLPRFDSGSTFARLLDWEHGGRCSINPTGRDLEYSREYRPDSLVGYLQANFVARSDVVGRRT